MAEASPALPPSPPRSPCPPPAVGAAVPGSRTQRLGTGAVGGAGVGGENRCGRRTAPGRGPREGEGASGVLTAGQGTRPARTCAAAPRPRRPPRPRR